VMRSGGLSTVTSVAIHIPDDNGFRVCTIPEHPSSVFHSGTVGLGKVRIHILDVQIAKFLDNRRATTCRCRP
jgi:hypothetical protein